jgi:hypothetical protein
LILIITIQDDIHALAVQRALHQRGYENCHILECDLISGRSALDWQSWNGRSPSIVTSEGRRVTLDEVTVIWWRRVRADQSAVRARDTHERELVNNDCRGALAGVLAAGFTGEWISRPDATDRAADKIYQLSVAADAGFRVPRTLVTQSRDEVVAFAEQEKRIIVKPVVGARGPLIFTQFLDDPASIPEDSYATCPAIYQEYIKGFQHVRLNCFGDNTYAALIETENLDWRPDLTVPVKKWTVPDDLAGRVRVVLGRLGLRMGVIDLKLTPDGEPVWLEVNPQGQFLFLEPLIREPLTGHFADFLLASA